MSALKSVLGFPLLLSRLALEVMTMALIVAFCGFFSIMTVLATPFWVFELVTARSWKFLGRAKFKDCESYFDWMFRQNPLSTDTADKSSVRMWGLQFEFTEWADSAPY